MVVKRRVILMCEQHLFGEILDHILNRMEEVELIGVWPLELSSASSLEGKNPDLLLIAEEKGNEERTSTLAMNILETYSNCPVIRVMLDRNVFQIYTSQTIPASVADLAGMIRQIPVSRMGA